jgi:hypothetical protein
MLTRTALALTAALLAWLPPLGTDAPTAPEERASIPCPICGGGYGDFRALVGELIEVNQRALVYRMIRR